MTGFIFWLSSKMSSLDGSFLMGDTDTIDGIFQNPIDDDGTGGGWPANDHGPNGGPRQPRSLSDKILLAFHHACDQGDIEVAAPLLAVLEFVTQRTRRLPARDRRPKESLVAAHERLWALRHPEFSEC
jgi:hypothetical protein